MLISETLKQTCELLFLRCGIYEFKINKSFENSTK